MKNIDMPILKREFLNKQDNSELSIYDYAKKKTNAKLLTFFDVYKVLLEGIDGIVCLESASDLLGYSNGGFRAKIKIYTLKDYKIPYLECIVVDNLDSIPVEDYHGIKVTPITITINDLLSKENSDSQIILETFANYYFEHNKSYKTLNIPTSLQKKAEFYINEGKLYYES